MEAAYQLVELLLDLRVSFEKLRSPWYTHVLLLELCLYGVAHIALKVVLGLHYVSWRLGICVLQDVLEGHLIRFLAGYHMNKGLDSRERLCTINTWSKTELALVI